VVNAKATARQAAIVCPDLFVSKRVRMNMCQVALMDLAPVLIAPGLTGAYHQRVQIGSGAFGFENLSGVGGEAFKRRT